MPRIRLCLLLLTALSLGVSACRSAASLPTPVPTAPLPTDAPDTAAATLPPTRDLATPTAEPTAVVPTRLPTRTPTPVIGPVIDINEPAAGAPLLLGAEATVSGFAQLTQEMSIRVGLTSAGGFALDEAEAEIEGSNWQASISVPEYVSGAGELQAVIQDAGGNEVARSTRSVMLEADREHAESYVTLLRPSAGDVAVAGHNYFLDGQLWRAGGGFLQVAVMTDDCQETVADVGFQLSGSTYWQGYVILPADVSGPACAMAWVGTPGEEDWRAAQVPITISAREGDDAVGIVIANPRSGRNVRAGETLTVNGVVYNAAGQVLNVTVELSNGRIVADTSAEADFYGYWTVDVTIPPGVEGEAVVRTSFGDRVDPIAQSQVLFDVVPAAE